MFEFNASFGIKDNLENLMKAKNDVEVVLKSGQTFQGKIKAISNHSLYLTELADRNFYDALISLDNIAALIAER